MQRMIRKHLTRMLPRDWERVLDDPRRNERRWGFAHLLQIAAEALVSGCKCLREVERLTEASGHRVPDTTLHDLLVQIDPDPLQEELARGVKEANRCHELDGKELPFTLTVIDGKCLSDTTYEVDEFSVRRSQKGRKKYVQSAIRAFHGSSTVKLLMGQERIPQGTNEKGLFPVFLEKLVRLYGKTNLLKVFSFDAGFTSMKNSQAVIERGYDYIFALKDPRIHAVTRCAMKLLGSRSNPDKTTVEYVKGKEITRHLYRCKVPEIKGWSHAKEFWRITKESVDGKTRKVTVEDHYYVTSLPPSRCSHLTVLKAVRIHWSIENNANWVMDVAWEEDSYPWCNQALELVSLMRMIAYNIVARFKLRRLRRSVARSWTWEQTLYFIKTALFPLDERKAFATR
jgi:predicted transposase YbfD/YdcC